MSGLWEIVNEVIGGLVVLVIAGAAGLLFRRLSARWRRLWQRMSEGRYVPLTFFLVGVICTFFGIVLTWQPLATGGLFLILASGLYALFFRRPHKKEPEKRAEPTTAEHQEPSYSKEEAVRATPPETTETPTTTTTSASSGPAVGDTATVESDISVTVLSYESPMPPPSFAQPDPGHEFTAIEVEWCTGPNYNGYINRASISYFTLQMPDNTHLRASSLQAKEPRLTDTPLVLPGECVRGWIMFQTPKNEVPKFVVFSGVDSVAKWTIPR